MNTPAAYPYQPVRERWTWTSFSLALLMHILLGALLYYGVHWRSTAPEGVQAELWEAIPETATPPEPVTKPEQAAKPVEEEEADIALQEKRRQAEAAAREQAQARQRERLAREEARKEALRKEAQQSQHEASERHQGELARLRALAGGAGSATGTGSAAGPSSGYADKVRRRVKPNIIFSEEVTGNPAAVVAVRMAPDGSLLSANLAKSSGNPAWDSAVLRAVSRSDPLPRDENGTAPASITITFRLKDQGG